MSYEAKRLCIVRDLIYGGIMFSMGYFVGMVMKSDDITKHVPPAKVSEYRTIDSMVLGDQDKTK